MFDAEIFSSPRLFEVWSYTVSHRQLLIRSNKSNSFPTRLEVLFKDVSFMSLPPAMNGMSVIKCRKLDPKLPAFLRSASSSKPWYRIDAEGLVGYVAAGAFVTHEDELEFHEPSGLLPPLSV
jgi:hypothetical protein